MIIQDDLLLIRLSDKIKKPKQAKSKKSYNKTSKRLIIRAKATKQIADKTERVITRLITPQQDKSNKDNNILVLNISLITGESQGSTIITLTIRIPERL